MLNFFRKYQKSFLVFIAIIIGISFSFFGTHYTLGSPRKVEDKKIGKAIDGSSMMQGEIAAIARFIATDSYEIEMGERARGFNLFNDGFIAKDIFSTGIGALLAETYFEQLKEELVERFERNKKYRPYAHPNVPFISLDYLWSYALPNQKKKLDHFFQDVGEMTPETFALLSDLYLGERGLPPSHLRHYLLTLQNQDERIPKDPALQTVSLSLFNCHSIEDWFGPKFLQLTAQFLHNMAILAEQKGYSVSREEARADLLQNGKRFLQMQNRGKEVEVQEVEGVFSDLLPSLALGEEEAIGVWRKVLLFRRLFGQVGQAVLLDADLYQNFHRYAAKGARVELYHLPEELHLKDFSSLLEFDTYLSLTAGEKESKDLHTLPSLPLPMSKIEQKAPSLLERRFLVEMSRVDLSELAREISLKEMWEWQLKEENFLLLAKEFPPLATLQGKEDSFYLRLEGLDPSLRQKVDRFSRLKMLLSHPQVIAQSLREANKSRELLRINGEYKSLSHPDLEEVEKLSLLLSKAPLPQENSEETEAKKALELFYDGEKAVYCFHVIDREEEARLLTFKEAKNLGVLAALVEQKLTDAYPSIRVKNPSLFQNEKGEWKPLSEVRDLVGSHLYEPVLKHIETNTLKSGRELPKNRKETLSSFYPKERLAFYVEAAAESIKKEGEKSPYLQKDIGDVEGNFPKGGSYVSQWSLSKNELTYKIYEKGGVMGQALSQVAENSYSPLLVTEEKGPLFFFLKEKLQTKNDFTAEIKKEQAILAEDAIRYFTTQVLADLKKRGAVHLQRVEESL